MWCMYVSVCVCVCVVHVLTCELAVVHMYNAYRPGAPCSNKIPSLLDQGYGVVARAHDFLHMCPLLVTCICKRKHDEESQMKIYAYIF